MFLSLGHSQREIPVFATISENEFFHMVLSLIKNMKTYFVLNLSPSPLSLSSFLHLLVNSYVCVIGEGKGENL